MTEPACKYCKNGTLNDTGVDCTLCGSVGYNHYCKKFDYDILKRTVRRRKDLSNHGFTQEDFRID